MQAICHLPVDEPFRLLRRYRCLPELAESISRPTRHRIVHLNDPYACQPSNDANEQYGHVAPCCGGSFESEFDTAPLSRSQRFASPIA